MKTNKILISLFVLGTLASCSEKGEEIKANQLAEVSKEHEHSEHNVEEVKGLTLNSGEKWVSNPETHKGMARIKALIEASSPNTVVEFQEMGDSCAVQTTFIINNCSMKGPEHNQLHFVLHPILDNMESLKKATTIEEGKVAYEALTKNIEDYFSHFQTAE